MEVNVITTYRCNARCGMCSIWQYPTRRSEEFAPALLEKLPDGISRLNITGGEPCLRSDLAEIVDILTTKTTRLQISTNGYFTERLERIGRDNPDLEIRISIEGLAELNDRVRGLRDGFDHAMRSFTALRRLGVGNLGFAMTLSGENCRELLDVYGMCVHLDCELANAVMHNSFYFHTEENKWGDTTDVEKAMKSFICALLSSRRPRARARAKDWLRAYINLGLLSTVQGKPRLLACRAGTDSVFLDPWGRVLACNGSAQPLVMGDLNTQTFGAIMASPEAEEIRRLVRACDRSCWMTGNAVPAMRRHPLPALKWVAAAKWAVARGREPRWG